MLLGVTVLHCFGGTGPIKGHAKGEDRMTETTEVTYSAKAIEKIDAAFKATFADAVQVNAAYETFSTAAKAALLADSRKQRKNLAALRGIAKPRDNDPIPCGGCRVPRWVAEKRSRTVHFDVISAIDNTGGGGITIRIEPADAGMFIAIGYRNPKDQFRRGVGNNREALLVPFYLTRPETLGHLLCIVRIAIDHDPARPRWLRKMGEFILRVRGVNMTLASFLGIEY